MIYFQYCSDRADCLAVRDDSGPSLPLLGCMVERGIPVVPKTVSQARMIEDITLTRLPKKCLSKW